MPRQILPFVSFYFVKLRIAFHDAIGLSGFMLFMVIYNQVVSGIMLSFSYATESMNIPLSREEEDMENRYIDDFFLLHERGVDLLELFLFIHLFRKLFLNVVDIEQEFAWKTGVVLFLLLQLVVFTGLVLCCTHLSDITLLIATNILQTFCLFTGKLYWLLFTDQTLNIDTVTRLGYLHFFLGIIVSIFTVYHGIDMHYDWKTDNDFDFIQQEINWFDEALAGEVGQCIEVLICTGFLCLYLYQEPEALSYEIFMWGDIGMITDIRFYGVAPHWYFRPYMSWLLSCPFHYTGIIGLVLFFVVFYFQPNLVGRGEFDFFNNLKAMVLLMFIKFSLMFKRITQHIRSVPDFDTYYITTYAVFVVTIWYAFSYLPYGRFFNRLGGNDATLVAFMYIFIYMSGLGFRYSALLLLKKPLY